ncbi:MAG: DNA primase [Lachnospiraceae bacterium]|nr:DNA primase [Lachnospiraceae bacterium]
MYIPNELVDRVIESNDIVDIIGTNVQLTRRGANYVGLCPFHNEKTPSFFVSRERQMYKCFGCGKAGGVITFLCEYENLTFIEALKELADKAGIKLPEEDDSVQARQEKKVKDGILEVNKEAATYYFKMLRSEKGQQAYKYLTDRGLSRDTINNFGLGFAGKTGGGLYEYLKSKGFSDELLKQTGLFSFNERGVLDKFWNRVMFPIMDSRGKVIAFGGRIMSEAKDAPKYLNSPETKAFVKGRNLYGYYLAKHTHEDHILLCEGYMDTIALHQAGFNNAVASLGTALTPDQAMLIARIAKKVVITYDQDQAGRNAALRAIPILKDKGISVSVLEMTPYKDPDEFIKNLGADEYRKRIEAAKEAFFFEAETLHTTVEDSVDSKTKFDHEIARKIASIDDPLERSNYINAVSKKYDIDKKALIDTVNKYGLEAENIKLARETHERIVQQRNKMVKPEDGQQLAEKLLVSMLANEKRLFAKSKGLVGAQDFTDPMCSRLYEIVFDLYGDGREIELAKIVNRFDDAEEQTQVAEILEPSMYREKYGEKELDAAFADVVRRVLTNSIEAKMAQATADNDAEALMDLMTRMKKIDDVHKKLTEPNR